MKPTKENTLYLTIKQKYFDEIMAGTKKNEYLIDGRFAFWMVNYHLGEIIERK